MARMLKRSLGVIPFVANQTSRLELPRNHVFKTLWLKLTGTITNSVAPASVTDENPMSLVKLARIIRNGSEVLQALDGGSLVKIATINRGTKPDFLTVTSLAVTTLSFDALIPIDFASFGLVAPSLTLLRAVGTTQLFLEISWGDQTQFYVGGTSVVNAVTQIEVFAEEIMDLSGDFGDKTLNIIEKTIVASQSDLTFDLPIGPLYRRLFLKATKTTDTLLDDALLNRVSVKSDGVFTHFDRLSDDVMRGINKLQYSLETLQTGNTTGVTGYYVIDFAEDGNLQGLIDSRGASSFQVICDVTFSAAQKLRLIPEILTPAKIAA